MKSPRSRVEGGGLVWPEALVIWSGLRRFPLGCFYGMSCLSDSNGRGPAFAGPFFRLGSLCRIGLVLVFGLLDRGYLDLVL